MCPIVFERSCRKVRDVSAGCPPRGVYARTHACLLLSPLISPLPFFLFPQKSLKYSFMTGGERNSAGIPRKPIGSWILGHTVIWCLRAHHPYTSGKHLPGRPSPSRSPVRRHLGHSTTAFRPIEQPCFIGIISSSRILAYIDLLDPLGENSSIPFKSDSVPLEIQSPIPRSPTRTLLLPILPKIFLFSLLCIYLFRIIILVALDIST